MGYVPLFFDVTAQPCVVIGGDSLAEHRVRTLLEAAADVTVISAEVTAGLTSLAANQQIRHRRRAFTSGDLRGFVLAWCYETDFDLGRAIALEARALSIPLNVADRTALCTFIAPAVVKRGALQIAISTGGASPALAKMLRQELEQSFGVEYATLLTILAQTRARLRECEPDLARRAQLSNTLVRELRNAITRGDYAALDDILMRHLGATLAGLGLDARLSDPLHYQVTPAVEAK
ncbi:MAG TPA: bifunctional precorrin-2 dehydrogenase/sirohydrochlorin ferrochelatase [Candidatus Binataceae bacterium]|nr:bifunctional precorrin-2 dehydrogenase/sirohydrochlorin ferrochelatase [Candidatus Binataceae bacterium]